MAIEVKLSSSLRAQASGYHPLRGLKVEPRPELTVLELITSLGLAPQEVKIIVLNGQTAARESFIKDGDRLGLFPAMGGG
ncbi:hypothetical protein AAU61_00395 [Desulfocarbo indianensis]|nr:hypothetical protein AAU61_00395 [Desulfocarbo indianensis]